MTKVQTKTEESKNEVVIKGKALIAYFGGSKHDKESKYRLALEVSAGMDDLRKLYSSTCESPLRPTGQTRQLRVVAIDNCGNKSQFVENIKY